MRMIILNGPIASGKTTLGKLLSSTLDKISPTVFLELDDEVKKFSPNFTWSTQQKKDKDWLEARNNLAQATTEYLENKTDVVVSGPFFQQEEIKPFLQKIPPDTEIYFYTLEASLELRKERLKHRSFSKNEEELITQTKFIEDLAFTLGEKIQNEGSFGEGINKIVSLLEKGFGKI